MDTVQRSNWNSNSLKPLNWQVYIHNRAPEEQFYTAQWTDSAKQVHWPSCLVFINIYYGENLKDLGARLAFAMKLSHMDKSVTAHINPTKKVMTAVSMVHWFISMLLFSLSLLPFFIIVSDHPLAKNNAPSPPSISILLSRCPLHRVSLCCVFRML